MEPLNPVEVEEAIRASAARVASSARIVSSRLKMYREAQRAFDKAEARAYLAHTGPAHARKYQIALDPQVDQLRDVMDVAEVALENARRSAKGAELELSAWQTLAKSVNAAYSGH